MATINYSTGPRVTNVGDHVVYTKATWAGTWTAQPNLVCTECQWRAAPEFSSALLTWRTGYIIPPGSTSPTLYGPWTARGHFVRIDWTCDDGSTLRWVGFIDASTWPTEAFGDQPLVCYGLERALALTPIMDFCWKRGTSDYYRSNEPPVFGYNRTKDPDSVGGVYVFCDEMRDADADIFTWTTREIVRYLLKYNVPSNNFGVGNIPWSVNQPTQLPGWDAPRVETRGRTVWDVLCELVNADRQLGMTVGSDGSTAYLRIFTHTSSTITVSGNTLAANPNQHTVIFGSDALTNATLSDVGGGYDQVICRGAKRQTICTLAHGTQLENDWTSAEETEYEAGASADAAYTSANTDTQRRMNARVRSRDKVSHVYSRFRIVKTFDWKISTEDLFPGNTNPRVIGMLDRLPIKTDVDWSGTVDTADLDRDYPRPWLALVANPDDLLKYVDVVKFALGGDANSNGSTPHDIAVSAEVDRTYIPDRLRLKVQGGPNHAIAGTNFTRLPVDHQFGSLDYTTLKLTVALVEDRFCEGKYPASAPSVDVVRRLFVDCGPAYMQVRIHKDTITDISPDGTEKKVTASGYLVDDSPKLAAIAQIIALGAVLTRKRVSWRSQRRISTIAVGDMINTAAGASVLAPVTSIRISAPTSVDRPSSCPTQEFETFNGNHDPLAVLRNLGMNV